MVNLTLLIGGMPLKIQCADNNVESVKEIASTISKLIQNEKKYCNFWKWSTFKSNFFRNN